MPEVFAFATCSTGAQKRKPQRARWLPFAASFRRTQKIKAAFGDMKGDAALRRELGDDSPWRQDCFVTATGVRVEAFGLESNIRGFSWSSPKYGTFAPQGWSCSTIQTRTTARRSYASA